MRWLFHALPRAAPAGERYSPESLRREGFLHASFRDALLESVRLHLPAGAALDVLQIDPRRLDVPLAIAETPRGSMPHVRGGIPADAVAARMPLEEYASRVATLPDRVTGTRIAFLAFEGMTLLDLVGVYDPLSRIATMGFDPASSCEIIGAHRGRVWAHGGAELTLDRVRPPLAEFDVLVVPGGPGTRVLEHDPSLGEWLASYPPNRLLASVCTGSLLLGAAGRLRGRRATSHHRFLERLADFGAVAVRERVVDEGQLITAAGVTSSIDLGVHLVRRLEGLEVAEAVAAQMEWQPWE